MLWLIINVNTVLLVELTIEANEEFFVIVHQHGGNDVNCKSRIVDAKGFEQKLNKTNATST